LIDLPASVIVWPVPVRIRPRVIVVPAAAENEVPPRTRPSKREFGPPRAVEPTVPTDAPVGVPADEPAMFAAPSLALNGWTR
jgi:hypothetical protein